MNKKTIVAKKKHQKKIQRMKTKRKKLLSAKKH